MKKERITHFGKLVFEAPILYVYLNEDLEITHEILKQIHQIGLILSEAKKHCVLADVSLNASSTAEARKYASDNHFMVNHVAYAMIGKSFPVNLLANFFINVNKPKVPTKLFQEEKVAVAWLKEQFKVLVH
jgi:hypothetical protein